jgi:hypothetical protein
MAKRKPRDLPLGFNPRDFKIFNPKRPRDGFMPIIGTSQGRRNEEHYDTPYDRNDRYVRHDGTVHVIHHDYEAEREREIQRAERQRQKTAMLFKLMVEFWIIRPTETIIFIIKKSANMIRLSNVNITPLGYNHIISSFFAIGLVYLMYQGFTNTFTYFTGDPYFFIFLLVLTTLLGAAIVAAHRIGW